MKELLYRTPAMLNGRAKKFLALEPEEMMFFEELQAAQIERAKVRLTTERETDLTPKALARLLAEYQGHCLEVRYTGPLGSLTMADDDSTIPIEHSEIVVVTGPSANYTKWQRKAQAEATEPGANSPPPFVNYTRFIQMKLPDGRIALHPRGNNLHSDNPGRLHRLLDSLKQNGRLSDLGEFPEITEHYRYILDPNTNSATLLTAADPDISTFFD